MKRIAILLCLLFAGCMPQLTLENQVKNKKEVNRVFINNPNCITVIYKTSSGSFVSEKLHSQNVIEYVESEDGMYVTWNTYEKVGNFGLYDMVVHLPNISALEPGENNKGKFGSDTLKEVSQ